MQVGAGAAGRGQDRLGAADAGLRAAAGGVAGAVLCGGFGDVAGVDVGDRLAREADHQQDEAEREQPFDQGVAALAAEPWCEPSGHRRPG